MNGGNKMKFKRKISILLVATLVLSVFLAGCAGSSNTTDTGTKQSGIDKKEIVIGCVGALTGPSAQLGKNLRTGVELAVADLNAKGGISGIPVRVIFRDDEADPTKSLNLVRELVEKEKIDVFIGPTNTTCANASYPYLTEKKIITMNGGCTGTTLINEVTFPYNFRTHVNNRDQAIYLAKTAVDSGFQRIAIVHDTSALGTGAEADMIKALKDKGATPIVNVAYNANDVDMLPIAKKLKEANPDICLFYTLGVDGARIVKEMEKIDFLPPKIQILGYSAMCMPVFNQLAGTAAKNVLSINEINTSYPVGGKAPQRTLEIAKKFEEKYGANDFKEVIFMVVLSFYDCTNIYAQAVEKADSLDPDAVKTAIESLETYDGVSCIYSFGANKHDGNSPDTMTVLDINKSDGLGSFEQAQFQNVK